MASTMGWTQWGYRQGAAVPRARHGGGCGGVSRGVRGGCARVCGECVQGGHDDPAGCMRRAHREHVATALRCVSGVQGTHGGQARHAGAWQPR